MTNHEKLKELKACKNNLRKVIKKLKHHEYRQSLLEFGVDINTLGKGSYDKKIKDNRILDWILICYLEYTHKALKIEEIMTETDAPINWDAKKLQLLFEKTYIFLNKKRATGRIDTDFSQLYYSSFHALQMKTLTNLGTESNYTCKINDEAIFLRFNSDKWELDEKDESLKLLALLDNTKAKRVFISINPSNSQRCTVRMIVSPLQEGGEGKLLAWNFYDPSKRDVSDHPFLLNSLYELNENIVTEILDRLEKVGIRIRKENKGE